MELKQIFLARPNWVAGARLLTLIGIQWLMCVNALAINKCVEDGKVSYQDAPCKSDLPTVGDTINPSQTSNLNFNVSDPQSNAARYKKLDHLAALGRGLVQQQPAPVQVATHPDASSTYQPRKSRQQIMAERDQMLAERANISAETNAKSTAALTNILQTTNQKCGDKLLDFPNIGMSDEFFRNCTTHAKFDVITQLVISEDGAVPIKLYIFSTARAQRVYSIGGIITAIKP